MNKQLVENCQKLPLSDKAKNQLPLFIKRFSGPENLQSLVLVAKSYLRMHEYGGFEGINRSNPEYRDLCREIVKNNSEILKVEMSVGDRKEVTIKTQIRGLYKNYPVYALMAFSYPPEEEKFSRLQQAIYVASHGKRSNKLDLLDHDIYAFSLLIRKLTDIKKGQNWLSSISLTDLRNFQSLWKALKNLEVNLTECDKHLKDQIDDCNNFILATSGLTVNRKARSESKNREVDFIESKGMWGHESANEHEELQVIVVGDPDEADLDPRIILITNKSTEEDIKKGIEFGIEPEEISPKEEYYLYVYNENLSAAGNQFQFKKNEAQMLNAVEKENQNLEYRNQRLSDQDIYQLFEEINNAIIERNGLIAMAVHSMFSLSAPAERIENLKIIRTSKRSEYIGMPNQICYDLDTHTWLVSPFNYGYRTEDIVGTESQSIQVNNKFVELPDMFEFYKIVHRVVGLNPAEDIFSNIEDFELKIKRLIKKVARGVTPSKVGNQILRIASSRIDPAVATLMLASNLYTSSATKYYTVRSLGELHHDYVKCTEYYSQLLNRSPINQERLESLEGHVGARYTPHKAHMLEVISKLKDRLDYIKQAKGPIWWVEFHNWYTVYCIYSQLLLTSLRAVKNPFLSSEDLIFNNEIAVFRDKDGEDEFHTRNIPCHKMVSEISENYNTHLDKVKSRLSALDIKFDVDDKVFLLDKSYKILEARPKNISSLLKEFTDLPLNSNRKFLRNFLMRSGVSNIAINTFMGHGSRGEKYSERYLTRALYSIREEIIPLIDKLITELDISPIKGLLR